MEDLRLGFVMDTQWITIALTLVGLLIQGIVLAVAGTWKLSAAVNDIRKEIAKEQEQDRRDWQQAIETDRRMWHDTLSALRQQINDVKLEGLSTFVRRDSFHELLNRMSNENKAHQEAMAARMDRFDMKLDRLFETRTP